MASDIEVDVQAVRRLETAAKQVTSTLAALEAQLASAGDVPSDAFGHLPFASDMLRAKYAEQVTGGTDLFRAAQAAFGRVASALSDTVEAYERNEQDIDAGFKAIQSGMPR
ncbi:hypothetical protein ACFOOK_15570 [Micromonospora krabiensis]|uniref:Excreted virulence factor EspC, type VII ESX diderm n=1 Tax=Micromonospora krabiensis TaxID=307121 RepID=A0A1C3N0N2_9ACTN|nr:hypothetical protein [Micromonospora krabiensis]SBV26139.1 hypothetical protein GA0070620_1624 [Micromonospora krabiensis]